MHKSNSSKNLTSKLLINRLLNLTSFASNLTPTISIHCTLIQQREQESGMEQQQHNKSRFGKENLYEDKHHVIGFPINMSCGRAYLLDSAANHHYQILPSPSKHYTKTSHSRVNSAISKLIKLGESLDIFAQGIREHVRIGPKLSETVKGKLRLGARILRVGGVEKVFKNNFNVIDGEKLFSASQCYLSTTAGPIAGLLFVSSERVAFCSDRSIKLASSSSSSSSCSTQNHHLKLHYKVMIPLRKIKRGVESENMNKPREKYVEIVTDDGFDFWFMGFFNHGRSLRYLHQAINQAKTADFWATNLLS